MKRKRDFGSSAVADYVSSMRSAGSNSDGKVDPINTAEDTAHVDKGRQPSVDDTWQQVDGIAKRKLKKLAGSYPAITHANNAKLHSPVKISDLQNLVLYLLADGPAPQWVSVRHHQNFDKVVVLMVPGLDTKLLDGTIQLDEAPLQRLVLPPDDNFPNKLATQKLPHVLQPMADVFTHIWPIRTPGDYRKIHSPLYAMLSSPIPRTRAEKNMKGPKPPAEERAWKNVRTPITEFVASRAELLENGFAIHPAHLTTKAELDTEVARRHRDVQSPQDGWIDVLDIKSVDEAAVPETEIQAGSILQGRQLLVMDCEMVTTTLERFSLARISLLDWDGNVVLDELVRQTAPVKDYLTPYSGITEELLSTATLTLPDIQERLRSLLTPRTILAGHSLDSDLRAVKIAYPFVIDSTLLYPHPKGPPQKSSLKWLTAKYLGRDIQQAGGSGASEGHDSIEDARACLDLIRQKCEKGKAWGTPEAHGESIFRRLARTGRAKPHGNQSSSVEVNGGSEGNENLMKGTGAMVDWAGNMHGFGSSAAVTIACSSDEEVVAGVTLAVNGTVSDLSESSGVAPEVPSGGCDMTFGRLRSLEYARGWTSRPEVVDPIMTTTSGTAQLTAAVAATVGHITAIHEALPPRTAFIVYSGSGDPREMRRLQAVHAAYKAEFLTTKWDQLKTQWTDTEEQALKAATEQARHGIGFVTVSGDDNPWALRKKAKEAELGTEQ